MTVAVGFCYGQTSQTPQWSHSYRMVLVREAAGRKRIVAEIGREASGVHIPDARCQIVREFLKLKRPEWLWMMDTDATFADDILDQLLHSADSVKRPILGALAFGVRLAKDAQGNDIRNGCGASPLELFPTLYIYDGAGTIHLTEYPKDEIVQVSATGAHCMVIHRNVLKDPRWVEDGHPLPWYRIAVRDGQTVSEDQFFCIRAQSFGYPIHVDTGIKTGHVKTFIADESLYLAQR